MFLIPLNQLESVELVIHALRAAGGIVDCTTCPAYKVCTKQCLAVADSIEQMIQSENLPRLDDRPSKPVGDGAPEPVSPPAGGHLRRIK